MADTGWKIVGTGSLYERNASYADWTNASNITVDDGTNASCLHSYPNSNAIVGTNISAGIPSDATIDGIIVKVQKYRSAVYTITDDWARIRKADGTYGSQNKVKSGSWATSATDYEYGGSSDLWNESWSASNINDTDFGFGLASNAGGPGAYAYCDAMWIKVYYTPAATALNVTLVFGCNFLWLLGIGINAVAGMGFHSTARAELICIARKVFSSYTEASSHVDAWLADVICNNTDNILQKAPNLAV